MTVLYEIIIGDLKGQHQTLFSRSRADAIARATALRRKGYLAKAYQVTTDLVYNGITYTLIGG
jgi:hypothetical protein